MYLIKFSRHVQVMDGWSFAVNAIQADKRIDLEVREMKVDVDAVQPNQEVHKGLLLGRRNGLEECGLDYIPGWEVLVNRNLELESLGVDVANVHSSFVSEEDVVPITIGVDADVEFVGGRVREERFDDEGIKGPGD